MTDRRRLNRAGSQPKRGMGGAAIAVRPNRKPRPQVVRLPMTGSEWLDAVLRALPVATALGFVLGLLMLNEIFGRWGFSAFQLIGPGDVLVPSLMIGIGASLLVTLPVGAALLLSMCMVRLGQDRKHRVTAGAILVSILAWPIFLIPHAGAHLWNALAAVSVIVILIGSGAAVWTVVEYFRSPPQSFLRRVMVAVATVWLAAWVGVMWRQGFELIVSKGLVRETRVAAAAKGADGAPCSGVMLWLGDRAAIIRCDGPAPNIRATTKIDNLVLLPSAAPQNPRNVQAE